ncbi:hypothetical protein WT83_04865 [Burkholderia territorii]|uniref:Uncharacterized protein n=1 Tax=Burkholderia territorii TaxID=1503055 RepID=A0A119VNZ0_9BURK|nr:hypothetical protein [Burkholderia territorii]KWN22006.1 hypothetical protein WT83_04865 [Burkholderia territorii]
MKWRQQSYAIPIALACLALTGAMTVITTSGERQPALAPLPMAPVDAFGPLLEQAHGALDALLKPVTEMGPPVQLPVAVAPVPVPLPDALKPVGDTALYELTTIVQGGSQRSAMINGRLVHVGDRLAGDATVKAIFMDRVKIERQGQTLFITMHTASVERASGEGDSK